MKIGLIADIHLSTLQRPRRPDPGQPPPPPPPEDNTRVKLRAFYEKAAEFDFVINLGDILQGSDSPENDYMTASRFSQSMISSRVNTYLVLGNHESINIPKELLLHTNSLGGVYFFEMENTLFVALDANFNSEEKPYSREINDWTDSYLPQAQLDFLEKQLSKSDKNVVVLCHQQLHDLIDENGKQSPYVVKNAEKVREILEKSGKVSLVLHGHYHPGIDIVQNGIRYFSQPGFAFEEKYKYSVLTIEDGKMKIEEATV